MEIGYVIKDIKHDKLLGYTVDLSIPECFLSFVREDDERVWLKDGLSVLDDVKQYNEDNEAALTLVEYANLYNVVFGDPTAPFGYVAYITPGTNGAIAFVNDDADFNSILAHAYDGKYMIVAVDLNEVDL